MSFTGYIINKMLLCNTLSIFCNAVVNAFVLKFLSNNISYLEFCHYLISKVYI